MFSLKTKLGNNQNPSNGILTISYDLFPKLVANFAKSLKEMFFLLKEKSKNKSMCEFFYGGRSGDNTKVFEK